MDIAEFLLVRIAEDEALLRRDDREPHSAHLTDLVGTDRPDVCPTCRGITLLGQRRALAECEAKRRIVAGLRTGDPANRWANEAWRQAEDDVLRLLAMPYADHADYQPEWSLATKV